MAMEYLNNGPYKIPILGLGTFLNLEKDELTKSLNTAFDLGYRHFDTATLYNNEELIGSVLKEWITSGKVKREELFITTKLCPMQLAPEKVESAIKASLEKLQLDYVDLYLIHTPMGWNVYDRDPVIITTDLVQVWKKMEEQIDAGRTRTIGLSNFNISQIERIKKIARIQPVNLQIEVHVYFQQRKLREFANKNNITIVAYAALGNPGIESFAVNGQSNFLSPNILGDGKIKKIADKHNKTVAQIAIKFLVQSGMVTIVKSSNPKRIKENIEIFDFTLDEKDLMVLESLDKGKEGRMFDYKVLIPKLEEHPEYPYHDY